MPLDDELLTVDEVAEALKVSGQTVRNWIDRGDLKSVRLGPRRVRIKTRDLQAFVDRGLPGVPEPEPDARETLAWQEFGQAMSRTTKNLRYRRTQRDLVPVLEVLVDATRNLAEALRSQDETPESSTAGDS